MVFIGSSNVAYAEVFGPRNCSALYSKDLVAEMSDQIDSRIYDLQTSVGYNNIFSTRGDGVGGWSRNASVWTNRGDFPLDLTGVSPWNSYSGYTRVGTLISPKHIVFANHFPIPVDTTLVFVDATGTIVSRTMQARLHISNTDIQIGLLNEAVPSTIAFYPILSSAQVNHYFSATAGMPIFALDQEGKVIVRNVFLIGNEQLKRTLHSLAPSLPRSIFTEEFVGGDSGNPGFLVVGDQLILNFTHTGPSHGIAHGHFINQINSAIEFLGSSGYEVSTFDLSCFTSGQIWPISETFSVSENTAQGKVVGTVYSKGLFPDHSPEYSILSGDTDGAFLMGTSTGIISVLNPAVINFDNNPSYLLTVRVGSVQVPNNFATTTVKIIVTR